MVFIRLPAGLVYCRNDVGRDGLGRRGVVRVDPCGQRPLKLLKKVSGSSRVVPVVGFTYGGPYWPGEKS